MYRKSQRNVLSTSLLPLVYIYQFCTGNFHKKGNKTMTIFECSIVKTSYNAGTKRYISYQYRLSRENPVLYDSSKRFPINPTETPNLRSEIA